MIDHFDKEMRVVVTLDLISHPLEGRHGDGIRTADMPSGTEENRDDGRE